MPGGDEVQHLLDGLDMLVVLAQRILKPVRAWAEALRPRGRRGVGDNGATVVLRFNDKDAARGREHMINLGRATLVRQDEMVQEMVRGARKLLHEGPPD